MIVTLAGHVDHGKTSLVRALTGVDTDRLAEEKRRGLTIDLGFAYLHEDLDGSSVTVGFVDVPGHHRFIHNMVAGVAADQHALLVIAADDGPMPQSREHLQILSLLGLSHGTIALSKCDRVSDERRARARAEIEALVRGSFLADADIVETSSTTGAGIDTLKRTLLDAARGRAATHAGAAFRLPIDRVFTVAGAGVVVTGTVHDGRVAADDMLHVFPSGVPVRVRSVHAQNRPVRAAGAGDRAALNVTGVDLAALQRGSWLTAEADAGSRQFAVTLDVLADYPRAIRHWLPVHVYHATSHSAGHLALLADERLAPGARAMVEVVTAAPLLVRPGDRIVIRDHGLDRTLGGGAVVNRRSPEGRRRDPERIGHIEADAAATPAAALGRHLALGPLDLAGFQANWGLTNVERDALLSSEGALEVEGFAVRARDWRAWLDALAAEIRERHARDPALQGVKQSDLGGAGPGRFLGALLARLVADGTLTVTAGRYLPPEHRVHLSPAEQRLLKALEPHLDQTQPPSLGDLSKQLRIPLAELARGVLPLVSKRRLVKISDNRYFLPHQLESLARTAHALGARGSFTARDYRDAAGIGRNVAIELLEFFDRRGITRRNGDERIVVGDPARALG